MTVSELTSRDNPFFKLIRLVAAQVRRAPEDLVLAEGIRSVEEAVAAGRDIDAVLFCSGRFGISGREASLLATLSARKIRAYRTSIALFKTVSDVQTPQGLLALVRVPAVSLKSWRLVERPLVLCACGLQDPGNLGTLIRSAAAGGVSLLCTMPGTVSCRNPKTVRASAGTFFRLPAVEHITLPEFLLFCREHSITPFVADAQGTRRYTEVDFTAGTAILLGNEGRGMADPLWNELESIRIPMAVGVESLNVGVAGALVIFEAFRQRETMGRGCKK